jgi:hypothetical protein
LLLVSTSDIHISTIFQAEIILCTLQFQAIQFAKSRFLWFLLAIVLSVLISDIPISPIFQTEILWCTLRFQAIQFAKQRSFGVPIGHSIEATDLQKLSFFGFPL